MVSVLPESQQKKALKYGIWGALLFRIVAVFLAAFLIKVWWFKILGGAYLLYVAANGFFSHRDGHRASPNHRLGFWWVVLKVELMDMAFSIDSILVAVAMTGKMWLIIVGGILGIVTMRFAAGAFIGILKKYPGLQGMAYVLVAIIGMKLIVSTWWHVPHWLFFGSLFLILLSSFVREKYRRS
jgi:YkoY family integral membrane protein